MGRMHAPGKGIASSALPYRRTPPSWLKITSDEVIDHIVKLARKGLTPSQIGVNLRDSHGVPQVRFVTGNKILRILKMQGTVSSVINFNIYSCDLPSLSKQFLLASNDFRLHLPFVWG